MATTMNSSLPDDLRAFADEHARGRAYGSNNDYMHDLIREQRGAEKLRGLLLGGAASPVEGEFDERYFAGLRERVHDRAKLRR